MGRDVGTLGEATLKAWCADAGVTANPVQKDQTGWDAMLEFPLQGPPASGALDKAPPPPTVRVQVKSTDRRRRRVDIKLTNWRRLIQSLDPAFILVLEFDSEPDCQNAFLIHVGESLIGRVLRRLRELSAADEQPALHKRRMSVAYGDDERLKACNGRAMIDGMKSAIGGDIAEYRKTKERALEELGYEGHKAEGVFSLEIPDEYRDRSDELLVDFDVGLVPELPLSKFKAWDVRFGVRSPRPTLDLSGEGAIKLQKKSAARPIELRMNPRNS